MSKSRMLARWMPLLVPVAIILGLFLVVGGMETAAAPSAAPALGITPTFTPTATPIVTPSPTGTRRSYSECDPIITKRAEPTEARPGDEVLFTIWVTNQGQKAAINTVVIDEISQYLEILDVSTSQGTWRQEGQKIIVEIGTIGQDYVVEIRIYTRVRDDAPTPLSIENLAMAKSDNCSEPSALALVQLVGEPVPLPVTGGFSTWWLLAAVLGTGLVATSLVLSRRSEN
jgi:uncharacterized repeat protein (TIGR01451 family)/LPXTG-motif cell wall-anchored protein